MRVIYLPIERLESRYSAQMFDWVVAELNIAGVAPVVITPHVTPVEIRHGQFLDVYGTCEWKSMQLKAVARMFERGEVESGDKFLIGDLWFPGLGSIQYMATLSGIDVEVWGWHYAGCSDPHDFVHPISSWARHNEEGWLRMANGVFLGYQSHARQIQEYFGGYRANRYPIGLAWDYWSVRNRIEHLDAPSERPKRVIFPHRGAPEKNPDAFCRMAYALRGNGYDFVITSSRQGAPRELGFEEGEYWRVLTGLSKQEYYEILAESRVFFSSAFQETFGYALHEAMAFDVTPVCPKRLCYPEALENDRYLYETELGGRALVEGYLDRPCPAPPDVAMRYDGSVRKALEIIFQCA